MRNSEHTSTLIIGASAAGLACAAALKHHHLPFTVVEQNNNVGNEWVHRYDRLHLHTPKWHSQLPYHSMPAGFNMYVSKTDFYQYLRDYAEGMDIHPVFNEKVLEIENADNHWRVTTSGNCYTADAVVVATGNARKPVQPYLAGMENFSGELIHSASYKNGACYKDRRVLVVGFGNSACEIALCLHEHGAVPAFSVRNPVTVVPRDIYGISIIDIVIAESILPRAWADFMNTPVLSLVIGDLEKYGLKKSPGGPLAQIVSKKKIPLLDIGTIKLIRSGAVKVFPGIREIKRDVVTFTDGRREAFDAIITATGFRPALEEFFPGYHKVCDLDGCPVISGKESVLRGLYFCGFHVVPTGMLREIGKEALMISKAIAASHSK